jgi:hypothetical protein
MMMFLEPFKAAAAEGAVVELKLRLLAGKIPALQEYAHQKRLEDIEADLAKHFDGSLSAEERKHSACAASFATRCSTPISAQHGAN